MTLTNDVHAEQAASEVEEPYLIVSSDGHAGPTLEGQLREYCPKDKLEDFDEYAKGYRARESSIPNTMVLQFRAPAVKAYENLLACKGLNDPHEFVKDMDRERVAAQVIFAGGGNPEPLPWTDFFNAGEPTLDSDLRILGSHIWNAWLADFCSVAPERMIGVAQIPIWDVDAAVKEVQWCAEHGIKAFNFPAPRSYLPSYNDLHWEPFWSAVEETNIPLVCHVGGGDRPPTPGPGALLIFQTETQWYSRRGLAHIVFGGVFDRHPNLRVGFVEQRAGWVPDTLRELDSAYEDPRRDFESKPDHKPSYYWRMNCFVGCSFMAHYEAVMRNEIGINTIVWGSDYPHPEGTWGNTALAIRNTFAGIPTEDVRKMIGLNGIRAYNLNEEALKPIASRIGPLPSEVDRPLAADEMPEHVGLAFRTYGPFA